jgi:hypothetical protein
MRKTLSIALFAAFALLLPAPLSPASATMWIESSPGGRIDEYLELFARVRASGERIVIDGPCLSACTLLLGIVPHDRVCATSRATLGFHAAWSPDSYGRKLPNPTATDLLMATYPASVRSWITRRGGLTSRLMVMRGPALASVVRPCESTREARDASRRWGRRVAATARQGGTSRAKAAWRRRENVAQY